jgi:hypothetical protein
MHSPETDYSQCRTSKLRIRRPPPDTDKPISQGAKRVIDYLIVANVVGLAATPSLYNHLPNVLPPKKTKKVLHIAFLSAAQHGESEVLHSPRWVDPMPRIFLKSVQFRPQQSYRCFQYLFSVTTDPPDIGKQNSPERRGHELD